MLTTSSGVVAFFAELRPADAHDAGQVFSLKFCLLRVFPADAHDAGHVLLA